MCGVVDFRSIYAIIILFIVRSKANFQPLIFTFFVAKVELSSSKNCFICFNESPLKLMKNVFYFTVKALFVLKKFKFLSLLFGHVEKRA